jgi:hypothetical protein
MKKQGKGRGPALAPLVLVGQKWDVPIGDVRVTLEVTATDFNPDMRHGSLWICNLQGAPAAMTVRIYGSSLRRFGKLQEEPHGANGRV